MAGGLKDVFLSDDEIAGLKDAIKGQPVPERLKSNRK